MSQSKKKAILVVSFGTSYNDTRAKTIDAIENDIADAFKNHHVYRAWTSNVILGKILIRDGIKINNVIEAMEQIVKDGIEELTVQPTHIINGLENDRMIQDVLAFQGQIDSIKFGAPLLTYSKDYKNAVKIIMDSFKDLKKDEMLVLMGHGTEHHANSAYAALDYTFKDLGYSNVHLGTVEAYPGFDSVLKQVKIKKPKRIILTPFMIVAGDHANNDMASEDVDSWSSLLKENGYEVSCVLKGLGEYKKIRDLFIDHITDITL